MEAALHGGKGLPGLILATLRCGSVEEVLPDIGVAFQVDDYRRLLAVLVDYELNALHVSYLRSETLVPTTERV
jgi:hypothetical protein